MTISHGVDETLDSRITSIENDLAEIKSTLESSKTVLVKADDTITKVAGEVMPAIQGVIDSPMLKMFVGKKK